MKGTLLLALRGREEPVVALEHAFRLALRLGHELRLLRVLEKPSRLRRLLSGKSNIAVRREGHEVTRAWLVRTLGEQARFLPITIALGEFVERTARNARATHSGLIVVAPPRYWSGGLVTALARRAGTPVLAVRAGEGGQAILAATDLRRRDLPVVGHAARLARELGADLVAFHNADPICVSAGSPALLEMGVPVVVSGEASVRDRRERLEGWASVLPVQITAVVSSLIDPVFAILEEARARNVGLIVVGTSQRSAWDRLMNGSIAAHVVSRTGMSVLVTPIGAPARFRHAQTAMSNQ